MNADFFFQKSIQNQAKLFQIRADSCRTKNNIIENSTYLSLFIGTLTKDIDKSIFIRSEAFHCLPQGLRISNRIKILHWHQRWITLHA